MIVFLLTSIKTNNIKNPISMRTDFFFMIKYSEDIFLSDNQGCKSRVRNSAAFEVLLSLFLVADCGVWTKYKEQE